jgi:hypothetical protein
MRLGLDDPNVAFTLYKKTDKDHFQLQTGDVEVSASMPQGIGVLDTIAGPTGKGGLKIGDQQVLIDPMTKEVISKTPELDEKGNTKLDRGGKAAYKVNDRWFRVDMKFTWKGAPSGTPPAPGGM